MKLEEVKHIIFLGIGGIGMSALARWFNANGFEVYGYDKTKTSLTQTLANEGMKVFYEDTMQAIPKVFETPKEDVLVVYTPAIPKDSILLNFFMNDSFQVMKRSELLGLITKSNTTIAVAGTHGKTTTSCMTAHILKSCGFEVSAFLGGIAANYNSNLILGERNGLVVVEADEYDRSFLRLSPDFVAVTNVEPDHLDIYHDEVQFYAAFDEFLQKTSPQGKVFLNNSIEKPDVTSLKVDTARYGLSKGDCFSTNIRIQDGSFVFDFEGQGKVIKDIILHVPGYHNVENATAAIALSLAVNADAEAIKVALASFKGVKRRFEYKLKAEDIVLIDDYAHHPSEIKAFIKSAKALYPKKPLTVVFQPHLFSRTQDFMLEFATALAEADQLVLLDIYPARELPIEGVSSAALLALIKHENKRLVKKEELVETLRSMDLSLLAMLGAGDIDTLVEPVKEMFVERKYV